MPKESKRKKIANYTLFPNQIMDTPTTPLPAALVTPTKLEDNETITPDAKVTKISTGVTKAMLYPYYLPYRGE